MKNILVFIFFALSIFFFSCSRDVSQDVEVTKASCEEINKLALQTPSQNSSSFRTSDDPNAGHWPKVFGLWSDIIDARDNKTGWQTIHEKLKYEISNIAYTPESTYSRDIQMLSYKILIDMLLPEKDCSKEMGDAMRFYSDYLLKTGGLEWDILTDTFLKMKKCLGNTNEQDFMEDMKLYIVRGATRSRESSIEYLDSRNHPTNNSGTLLAIKTSREELADAEYALAKLDTHSSK
jgi:hypothetical protein